MMERLLVECTALTGRSGLEKRVGTGGRLAESE